MNLFLRLCLSPLTCLERFQFKIPYSSKRFQSIPLIFFGQKITQLLTKIYLKIYMHTYICAQKYKISSSGEEKIMILENHSFVPNMGD